MRRYAHGLVAAMEEDTNTPPTEGGSAVPAEAPAESVETELIDVNEGAAEGEAVDAAVEEAVDAAAAMESLMVGMEAFKEKGGLTEQGAWGVHQTIALVNKRMGTDTKIPAMESFTAPSSRMQQHRVALESIKDTLARIWKAIKDAIKKSIEWVQNQFEKLFGAATKLKKRAEALTKAASDISGTAKETKFDNERIAKALSINGQAPTNVADGLGKIHAAAEFVFGKVVEFNSSHAEAVIEALNNLDDGAAFAKVKVAGLPTGNGFSPVQDAEAKGYAAPGDGLSLASCAELPGNKTVLLRGPAAEVTGEAAVSALAKSQGNLITFNSKQKEVSNFSLKTLSGGDIEGIAKVVIEICDSVLSHKAKLPKAKDLKSKLITAADKAEKAALKEEDKEKSAAGKAMATATHNVAAGLDKPAPQLQAYALNTCKSALDYCDLSLKQYGTK